MLKVGQSRVEKKIENKYYNAIKCVHSIVEVNVLAQIKFSF